MKMPSRIIAALVCAGALPYALAADFDDTARVVRAVPHMQQVSHPRQECRTVMVPTAHQARNPAGAIVGGVAGGVVGHQFGKGSGKAVATVAGVVGGALVGDHLANQNTPTVVTEHPVQECRTVEVMESRPAGYEVTYVYRGKSFTTILPYAPGDTLPVRVNVQPM